MHLLSKIINQHIILHSIKREMNLIFYSPEIVENYIIDFQCPNGKKILFKNILFTPQKNNFKIFVVCAVY